MTRKFSRKNIMNAAVPGVTGASVAIILFALAAMLFIIIKNGAGNIRTPDLA
jgi:hypothetical protein